MKLTDGDRNNNDILEYNTIYLLPHGSYNQSVHFLLLRRNITTLSCNYLVVIYLHNKNVRFVLNKTIFSNSFR